MAAYLRSRGHFLVRSLLRAGPLRATRGSPGPSRPLTVPLVGPLAGGSSWGHCRVAFISTSEKSKVVSSTAEKIPTVSKKQEIESLEDKDENWMTFGFSLVDRDEDEWASHMAMFTCVTLLLCCGTFYMAYYPDFGQHDWAQREAYLELERREKNGLPLIDPNMICPEKVQLPSEEELGDFEIII